MGMHRRFRSDVWRGRKTLRSATALQLCVGKPTKTPFERHGQCGPERRLYNFQNRVYINSITNDYQREPAVGKKEWATLARREAARCSRKSHRLCHTDCLALTSGEWYLQRKARPITWIMMQIDKSFCQTGQGDWERAAALVTTARALSEFD